VKLLGLDLIAFGPFTGASLDLSGGSEGLHLVYGPNEAGKSSALRAVRQLFTEIPHRSADDFVHKHEKMRLGARVRNARGEVLEFRRRKGNKNTLLGPDDAPLDDARLAAFLGGLDPAEFATKFAIGHDELVAGGKAVIAGGGDIGRLLFAAGAGLTGLAGVQKRLEDDCDELFKRGGSKPRINATWSELEAARKARNEAALRGSEWLEHDENLRRARAAKRETEESLERARREAHRLRRFEQALGPIARRKQLRAELAPLADAVLLPADFVFRHREAVSFLQPAELAEADAHLALERTEEEIAELDVPEALLEQAEAIEHLHLRLGSHQQAARDRARLAAERAQLEAEAGSIRRDLGLDRRGADVAPLTTDERVGIQDLGNQQQVVFKARDDARKALEAHAAKVADAAGRLEALGPARDPSALRRAAAQAQRQGDLDESVRLDRGALVRDERRADADLAALGLWSGPLDGLERLAVPSAETVERFQAETEAEGREVADLRARVADLEAQAGAADAQLEQLRLEREVPAEDDLDRARRRRHELWRRLKQAWDTGPAGEPASEFERGVAEADAVADRLRREADRIATKAKLLAERGRCLKALDEHRGRYTEAQDKLGQVRQRWATLWAPLGVAPLSPREMLAWSRKQADLTALARSVRERRLSLDQREAKLAHHVRELGESLEALGEPPGAPGESLAERVERAQGLSDTLAEAASARERLRQDLAALEAERPGLAERAEAAEADLARWQSRWADAVRRLGLPPDASPSQANAVAGRVADLFDRLDKAEARRREVEAIDREAGQFERDVRALAERAAPDVARLPAERSAAELNARLTRARAARQHRQALDERRGQSEQAARSARSTAVEMRARLRRLCREARCDREDDLAEVEERSARRQALETELAEVDRHLFHLGGSEPLDDFIAEAESTDPDALAVELGRLDAEVDRLEHEREGLDQAIGREEEILKRMDGNPRAADADQEAENLRARIRSDVERYARLRLAAAVLREGVERYRQKRQGPVLARAGALFAALTLGSFERLSVDYDERDEAVLKGVRPGGELVGVEGMSAGTADQLYLALRLASLETYLDRAEPVPLVVDDILIHFDDDRASAALCALADLSRRTQVLLFTHHQRLVELAESRLDPGVLFTHDLPGRGTADLAAVSDATSARRNGT
jgi:uncharacterized protein YhaN